MSRHCPKGTILVTLAKVLFSLAAEQGNERAAKLLQDLEGVEDEH
jgi:hypothetical protein